MMTAHEAIASICTCESVPMITLRHLEKVYKKTVKDGVNAATDLAAIIDEVNVKELNAGRGGLKYIYMECSSYLQNVLPAISACKVQTGAVTITRLPQDSDIPWCCKHTPCNQRSQEENVEPYVPLSRTDMVLENSNEIIKLLKEQKKTMVEQNNDIKQLTLKLGETNGAIVGLTEKVKKMGHSGHEPTSKKPAPN